MNPLGRLTVWDAVSLIVGIVVGTAIFASPPMVFASAGSVSVGLAMWIAGGLLTLVGALCYCELATTFPRLGGDYVYLTEAFGRWCGFLFAWLQLSVILPSNTGAMAFVCADYLQTVSEYDSTWAAAVASVSVIGLTVFNLCGLQSGRWVQHLLTWSKVAGLLGVLGAGLYCATLGDSTREFVDVEAATWNWSGIGLALVFVLYAYGGWNDAAFVAAEVEDPSRSIPRAWLFGLGGIALLYLLVNAAYIAALGFDGVAQSDSPASDVLQVVVGPVGRRLMGLLVMISSLGAINGMLFTGSRVVAVLGEDHRLFARLGRWSDSGGVPAMALIAQCVTTCLMILAVGTEAGRRFIDFLLESMNMAPMPWEKYHGGFETLVAGTAPLFWTLFLATGIALFVLRFKYPDINRPFRVPLYPLTPILFCLTCCYMLHSSITYAGMLSLIGALPVVVGIPLYLWSGRGDSNDRA